MNNQSIVFAGVQEILSDLATKNALVIYSPTTIKKATSLGILDLDLFNTLPKLPISYKLDGVSYDTLEKFDLSNIEVFVGLGGGTVIDVAKFLSHRHKGSNCVAIPSMLSTNVFATNKVAAIRKSEKITEDAKLPETVVFDEDLLNLTKRESLYGLADAYSVYTATNDWRLADMDGKEPIDLEVYGRAREILSVADIVIQEPSNIGVFNVLREAGYITNDYGCGRPESGSEHIIAKEIEKLVQVPHALAVTCGIAIASQLQGLEMHIQRCYTYAVQPLKEIGVFDEIKNSKITPEILYKALQNVKPREDRYTVLDRGLSNKITISELIHGSGLYD